MSSLNQLPRKKGKSKKMVSLLRKTLKLLKMIIAKRWSRLSSQLTFPLW